MTLSLTQSATAVGSSCVASFLAINGTGPYTYAVLPGGAGGTINASTGEYTAPAIVSSDPRYAYDTIQVTDSTLATATAQILAALPLLLACEIFQHEMGLDNNHCYLWDQKIFQPKDSGLYIAISQTDCKPIGNVNNNEATEQGQYVSMSSRLDLDIISRGPAARDLKESVLLAVGSQYSQQQQNANAFYISPLTNTFTNLSPIDGAAIPYRYRISFTFQYFYQHVQPSQYFDTFEPFEVFTDD